MIGAWVGANAGQHRNSMLGTGLRSIFSALRAKYRYFRGVEFVR
jgi:hypothetical protein